MVNCHANFFYKKKKIIKKIFHLFLFRLAKKGHWTLVLGGSLFLFHNR